MSTSLSQDNIQVNDKVSEEKETLFKNKLLLQSFQQSDNKPNMNNNSGEKNGSEDQYKKIKDDLNKLFEKKTVEESLHMHNNMFKCLWRDLRSRNCLQ